MKMLTFHQRILLGMLILLVVTTATLTFAGANLSEEFLRTRFKDRMTFLARYLALNSEIGLLIDDREGLRRLAGNLLSERDVVQVIIKDAKGRVVIQEGEAEAGAEEVSADVMLRQQEEERPFLGGMTSSGLLGSVHILYTTESIDTLLKEIRHRYFMAALLIGLVAVVTLSIFSRRLANPLKELVGAASRVAGGDLETRVEGGSLPETMELASSFNQMMISLAQNRRELEEAYQEMIRQKALAEVGHFAMSVAHEVKNPLGIIKGALEIMKKSEVAPETRDTMIEYVEDEVRQLNRLIQNFLDFSRPRPPNFRELDLNALLREVVDKMGLEWKGIEFQASIPQKPFYLQADGDMLSQALINIIKNGCEACGGEGRVIVSVGGNEALWEVRIGDSGPGFAPGDAERIFDPFFTTKAKGTGLGLALVSRCMEAHGGEIRVDETAEEGAVFILRLWSKGDKEENVTRGDL